MEAVFKASIPEPVRILGLSLLPFSLGRYRILKRFNCAYVSDAEASASIEDLFLGVLVCSQTVRDFLELIEHENLFSRELKRWGKHIRKEVRAEAFFNLPAKHGLFKWYLSQAAVIPNYFEEANFGSTGGHWSHAVEITLRSELGYTTEEINEGPIGKSLGDYFQWAHSNGLIRLTPPEDEAALAEEGENNFKAIMAAMGHLAVGGNA